MVDKKITELTELTTPVAVDVIAIVDDPAGSPTTKKITYANIEGNLSITGSQVSDFNASVNSNGSVVSNTTHRGTTTGNPHSVLATEITDFDTEVNNNGSVVLNTTHRIGDGSDHADVASNTSNIVTLSGVVVSVSGAGATHEADSSDPHGATLTQTNISSTGLISGTTLTAVVGDHGTNTNPELVNTVYSSGSTPPTASTTTEGTLFVQYTV